METYNRRELQELGIVAEFVQDNHSASAKGTVRGLHYQLRHPQAKLCRVVEGEVLDVVVDIRVGSPQFGQFVSVVLKSNANNQIYIPTGFAHGFAALTDHVQFLYKCSDYYDAADEYGIAWNDPALNIPWRVDAPIVSEKDSKHLPLAEISPGLLPRYTRQ
jgi:dTDP-4-dehydrorhamnose 3,5-epimerase